MIVREELIHQDINSHGQLLEAVVTISHPSQPVHYSSQSGAAIQDGPSALSFQPVHFNPKCPSGLALLSLSTVPESGDPYEKVKPGQDKKEAPQLYSWYQGNNPPIIASASLSHKRGVSVGHPPPVENLAFGMIKC